MLLYLDASALVKHYVLEKFSDRVEQAISDADIVGTSIVSRAEVSAALGKAVRVGTLKRPEALRSLKSFRDDWESLARIQVTEIAVARADTLAFTRSLKGYDAVHLASALVWREAINETVCLATYDLNLWNAARLEGLELSPDNLPALLRKHG
jgi:predicted nucleic acid-binding protein